ncbi:hypothetical protein FPK51_27035, partial [Acinetobacter baumannii]|nr:hypothetical protein [Acinetobacter baumannii]
AFGRGPQYKFDGLGAGPWGRITPVNPANGGQLTNPAQGGFNQVLNHTGTYDGIGVGADPRNPANYHNNSADIQEDKYNSSQDMDLL